MKVYNFLVRLLDYCRVSVIVIIAGGIILAIDQGAEITVRLGDSAWRQVFFIAAVSFWAWQSWFWSRITLNDRFPNPDGLSLREKRIVSGFPRFLGTLAFSLAIFSMWQNRVFGPGIWILSVIGILSVVYWIFRGKIPRRMFGVEMPDLKPGKFTRFTYLWFTISGLVVSGFAIWAVWWPVNMGFSLGSGAVVFIALASVAAVGNTLVYWTRRHGFPLVIVGIAVAGFWSWGGWWDNHGVRLPEEKSAEFSAMPKPLEAAFKQWTATPGKKNRPFVVVATSGGGLRAAYWTATVLGALQDADPTFADHLFAVSGVSGGSLGAVVFNGLLASGNQSCRDIPIPARKDLGDGTCFEVLGQEALSADFLAPSVTAMMYGDLMHRFLPFLRFDDRAKALEEGWEAQWEKVVKNDLMKSGFRQLWRDNMRWLPGLLLNGTHEETGRRLITSNLAIDSKYFPDAFDFFADKSDGLLNFAPGEISTATAAHNSARFSYVSPAGTLSRGGHIIDGGYFENYGAQTLNELLDAVLAGWEIKNPKPGQKKVLKLGEDQPILVIQITNEPEPEDILAHNKPLGAKRKTSFFNEIAAPIRGLLNTREARGVSAAKVLKGKVELPLPRQASDKSPLPRAVIGRKMYYAHFRLSEPKKTVKGSKKYPEPVLALGWVLSQDSECSMRLQLRAHPDNRSAFAKVINVLKGGPANGPLPEGTLRKDVREFAALCGKSEEEITDWSFIGK